MKLPCLRAAAQVLTFAALVMGVGEPAVAQEGSARLEVSVTDASSGATVDGVELNLPGLGRALVTGAGR